MVAAIIVAAGNSQRMGFDKLTALLNGKPVLQHTLAAFEAAKSIDEIVLVARADRQDEFSTVAGNITTPVRLVVGGARRQDSVQAGLNATYAEIVAVHDAARPLIRPDTIDQLVALCRKHRAVALAAPVTDTLKRADQDRYVVESIDRANVFAMQTPQVFDRHLLERAFIKVAERNLEVTDEVSAVELLGEKVLLLENSYPNPKITFASDLALAQSVAQRQS